MRAWSLVAALVPLCGLVACAAPDDPDAGDESHVLDNAPDSFTDGKADGIALPGTTIALMLTSAAVPGSPGHPNAVVYVPRGYRTDQPLDVVVYLHGWWNCASNVVRSTNGTCGGAATRNAYGLAAQLEKSGKNAVLLVPELAYEQASSAPGALATPGVFSAMMEETLVALAPTIGAKTIGDLDQVIVASHSGGYVTAARILSGGGLDVREVWLLDSLYGETAAFDAWVGAEGAAPFAATPHAKRLAIVYTGTGGTLGNSQAMATRARGWLGGAAILDDRSGATLDDAAFDHGLVFKRSGLTHDNVPRYYVGRLLTTSGLPAR
jgi:hypothetical protein